MVFKTQIFFFPSFEEPPRPCHKEKSFPMRTNVLYFVPALKPISIHGAEVGGGARVNDSLAQARWRAPNPQSGLEWMRPLDGALDSSHLPLSARCVNSMRAGNLFYPELCVHAWHTVGAPGCCSVAQSCLTVTPWTASC